MKVLVIGASGMIGSSMLNVLSENSHLDVFGTVRNESVKRFFSSDVSKKIVADVDVKHSDSLPKLLDEIRPDVVVNCAGLTKHKPEAEDPLVAIPINSLMPHRLAALCKLIGARLIHVSSDCVFSGEKGNYLESDFTDANDVYGKSKALGEVAYPHAVTLRTSTIGKELQSTHGLLNWFLQQNGRCKGYTKAIFSGLPTVIFSQVVRDFVIPNSDLAGLYHVAAEPIAKYDLLQLISKRFGKDIEIIADDQLVINRSLNGLSFRNATGFVAPDWDAMIKLMFEHK